MIAANLIHKDNVFELNSQGRIERDFRGDEIIPQIFKYHIQNNDELRSIILDD